MSTSDSAAAGTPARQTTECWHGHKVRQVGCVSCVIVFDRPAEKPPVSGEGTGTLTPEDRFTKETLTPLERARFAIHAEAPNRDLLQALVGEIDRIVALLAAKDAQLAALRTEREEMLIERGQLGVRHARLVETRDSLESTLADLRRQGEWQPTKEAVSSALERLALVEKCSNPKPCQYCTRAFSDVRSFLAALRRPLPDPPAQS